jgi:hypothetical protein
LELPGKIVSGILYFPDIPEDESWSARGSIEERQEPVIACGAFKECTGLTSVVIHEGVEVINCGAFEDCTSLESVNLPESIKIIKERAFWGCKSLAMINIPDSLKEIEKGAFCKCGSLDKQTYKEIKQKFGADVFKKTARPEGILP